MHYLKLILTLSLITIPISCKNIEDAHKNEYSASIGAGGAITFSDSEMGETDKSSNCEKSNTVMISGSYEHHLTNWLYVGMSASYFQRRYEVWEGEKWEFGCGHGYMFELHRQLGNHDIYYLSFLPTMKFNWLRKKYFTMYSRLSAGCTYRHENMRMLEGVDTFLEDKSLGKTFFMYQISPLGLEVGTPHFRLFAELGWGATAVQSGLRIRY